MATDMGLHCLHMSHVPQIGMLGFLAVPRVCLQFVNVVFPYNTHLLFFIWVKLMVLNQRNEIIST